MRALNGPLIKNKEESARSKCEAMRVLLINDGWWRLARHGSRCLYKPPVGVDRMKTEPGETDRSDDKEVESEEDGRAGRGALKDS